MTIDDRELMDRLDGSFGEGPALPPPAQRLAEGRRALRRRRWAAATGAAGAVAVACTAVAVLTGGGGSSPRGAEPAATPRSSATSSQDDVLVAERQAELARLQEKARLYAERARRAQLVSTQFPASLDPVDGSLVVKRGWEVVQQVAEPVGYRAPEASLGVALTDGDTTRWMLLTLDHVYDENGNVLGDEVSPSASADDAGKGYARFEDWLASMVELQGGSQTDPLVVVGADDEVVAGPGATLVDLQVVPVVEGYTAPGDRVAQVRREGRTWWVVVRGHGEQAETIPVDGDVLPDSTLDALLAYLAQQTESGEGVR